MPYVSFIRRNPFFRIAVFYSIGLIAAHSSEYTSVFILTSSLLMLAALMFRYKNGERLRHFRGILVFLIMSLTGYFNYQMHAKHQDLPEGPGCFVGIVTSPLIQKENLTITDCMVTGIKQGYSLVCAREKIRLYIRSEAEGLSMKVGDSLWFSARPSRIKNRGNPGEFDFAAYLRNEGIQYSAYLKSEDLLPGGDSGEKSVLRFAEEIRQKIIDLFRKNGLANDELGVLSALVAGDRQYLSEEVRREYASAGAMHILAVSGLHVGILYLFLNLLFSSRCQLPVYRLTRLVFILACLWTYALIAGLSPSIIRASLMFSFFLAGKNIQRSSDSYNMLFASALIILFFDPFQLFKPGFQFSYLAVLGILFFQPRLESLLIFRRGLPDRIWQLITVSLAAQFTTLPLALFYFHQFPVYFLLTNLFIIPLIWLIMINTLLLFFVSFSAAISGIVAKLLNCLLILNNKVISLISSLPSSIISDIRFESYHLLILFPALLALMHALALNKLKRIPPILLLSCIFCLSADIVVFTKQEKENQLIIYNQNNQHIISYIQSHQHLLITKARDTIGLRRSLEYLEPFLVSRQIQKAQQIIRVEEYINTEIRFGSFRLRADSSSWSLELDSLIISYPRPEIHPQKYKLILVDRNSGSPSQLKNSPDGIILQDGIPYYQRAAWLKYAEKTSARIHDMKHEGAFIQPL